MKERAKGWAFKETVGFAFANPRALGRIRVSWRKRLRRALGQLLRRLPGVGPWLKRRDEKMWDARYERIVRDRRKLFDVDDPSKKSAGSKS